MEWPFKRKAKAADKPPEKPAAQPATGEGAPALVQGLDTVSNPEQFMAAVDFRTLNEIFDSITERSGAKSESIERSRIRIVRAPIESGDPDALKGGMYDRKTGTIILSWDAVTNKHHPDGIAMLHALAHEVAHARSAQSDDFDQIIAQLERAKSPEEIRQVEQNAEVTEHGIRAGFVEVRGTGKEFAARNVMPIGTTLNEAVTERLAIEVLGEYLRRMGTTSLLTSQRAGFAPSITESYIVPRAMLGVVMESLAHFLSSTEDEVWRGFVASYFAGDTRTREIITRIAEEIASDSLAHDIVPVLLAHDVPESSFEMIDSLKTVAEGATMRALHGLHPDVLTDALKLR